MSVLILSHRGDTDAPKIVQQCIADRGQRAFIVSTDLFPQRIQLTNGFHNQAERVILRNESELVDLKEVSSIWYRRLAIAQSLPLMRPDEARICRNESSTAFLGALAALGVYELNQPHFAARASHKALQLSLARKMKLIVPATCITNDPIQAKRFIEAHPLGAVIKLHNALSIKRRGKEYGAYTQRATAKHVAALGGLQFHSAIFQARVERQIDIRTVCVGNQFFTAALDAENSSAGNDWRLRGASSLHHFKSHDLPKAIEKKLLALMKALRLDYGAIDLAQTPSGEYVFFEVNPHGEFTWLERSPGLPIADAIAALLLEKGRPARPRR
jgi:glutathione synthase/RimK-type ligase-like ATP-grasp enzyme